MPIHLPFFKVGNSCLGRLVANITFLRPAQYHGILLSF